MKASVVPNSEKVPASPAVKRSRWRLFAKIVFLGVFTPAIGMTLFLGFQDLDYGSRQLDTTPAAPLTLDLDKASATLSRSIQFKTVQNDDAWELELTPFSAFRSYLIAAYPTVFRSLSREVLGRDAMLLSWQVDSDKEKPILLMSNMDVDNAEEDGWTHRPFGGHDDGTFIWGRGTRDGKASLIAILEAIKALLAEGFVPRRSIFVVFSADSKSGGTDGARAVADAFMERGHRLSYVLATGPMIRRNILPGVDQLVASIGIAETGSARVEITLGTQSTPVAQRGRTPAGIIAEAVHRTQETHFPARFDGVTRATFDFVGPELGLPDRAFYANPWLFEPLLRYRLNQSNQSTTLPATQATPVAFLGSGSKATPQAPSGAIVDLRIAPGDDLDGTLKSIRSNLNGLPVKVALASGAPLARPSPVSGTESDGFRDIQRTIGEIFPRTIVAPGIDVNPTDARHFIHVAEEVYRFRPFIDKRRPQQADPVVDERVSKREFQKAIEFYVQFLRNAGG